MTKPLRATASAVTPRFRFGISSALLVLFGYYLGLLSSGNSQQQQPQQQQQQTSTGSKNRHRRFVSYTSSPWEKLWLDKVDVWADQKDICRVLVQDHAEQLHDFLNLTCTSRMPAPHQHWCVQDDNFQPFWYNSADRTQIQIQMDRPSEIPQHVKIPPPSPVLPTAKDEHIVSKFVFLDEATGKTHVEYIEPLVSHLRWPLAGCIDLNADHWIFRGYVIPPPAAAVAGRKSYYFDAGASSWNAGGGGPSLSYFSHMWSRHGIHFDEIRAFEMTTPAEEFHATVPESMKKRTFYQQCAVSSTMQGHTEATPFIPKLIADMTEHDSYVLFKLDIDSPAVENSQIEYILANSKNTIAELAYEHHVAGNYLMVPERWGPDCPKLTLRQSYDVFLNMRKKGIRAHSWI